MDNSLLGMSALALAQSQLYLPDSPRASFTQTRETRMNMACLSPFRLHGAGALWEPCFPWPPRSSTRADKASSLPSNRQVVSW